METKNHKPVPGLLRKILFIITPCLLILTFPSCQEDLPGTLNGDMEFQDNLLLKKGVIPLKDPALFWGHHTFTRGTGKPVKEIITIPGDELINFEGCLHLKIIDPDGLLPGSAVMAIDGEKIAFPGDFNHTWIVITREICRKSGDFTLEAELRGKPGSSLEVWIEGTLKNPIVDLRDRQTYGWVKIGNQHWMAENMAFLPEVLPPTVNSSEDISRKCYYVYGYSGTSVAEAKATENYKTFGVLYNWPAAMDGADSSRTIPSNVRGICPEGWHVPSYGEWLVLQNYLIDNNYGFEGNPVATAKSIAAKTHWAFCDIPGTPGNDPASNNATGFSALPGGYVSINQPSSFSGMGTITRWWSTTEEFRNESRIWCINLRLGSSTSGGLGTSATVTFYGMSVRCIKD